MNTFNFFSFRFILRTFLSLVLLVLVHACSEKIPPEVSTVELSGVKPPDCGYSEYHVIIPAYGIILKNNGDILEAGFCLSEINPEPTVNDIKNIAEITSSTFLCCIWIPCPSKTTTYFIRAYAINEHGVGYSPVVKGGVGCGGDGFSLNMALTN